jgi:hypothetical protein
MKVVRIGDITLDNPMFVKETGVSYKIASEVRDTIAGGKVYFESVREPSSFTLTLESGDYGWQRLSTVQSLISLSEQKIGDDFEVRLDDGSAKICRFRYEVSDGRCVDFEPVFEGANIYKGSIYIGVSRW